ncbi:MAG TPA: hypothetical protein PKD85_15190 [Saprospiraceae bacterium]|nr:hypothetical protein [Saprospiraceae bacterium]
MKKYILITIVFSSIFLLGCNRENLFETEVEDIPVTPVELRDMVILGFTKDKFGNPLADVEVKIGEISVISNKEGIYHFERVSISTTGSIARASKFQYESELVQVKPNSLGILQVDFELAKTTSSFVGNINANNQRLNGKNFILNINHATLSRVSAQNNFSAILQSVTQLDSITPILLPATNNPKPNQDVEITEQFELQIRSNNSAPILKSDTIKHLLQLQSNDQQLYRLDLLRGMWILEKSEITPNQFEVKQNQTYGIGNFTTRYPLTLKINNSNKDPLTNIPYLIKTIRGTIIAKGLSDGQGIIASRLPNNIEFVVELVSGCDNLPTRIASGKIAGAPSDLGTINFTRATQLRMSFKSCDDTPLVSSRSPYTIEIKQGRSSNRILMLGNSINTNVNLCPSSGLIELKVKNGEKIIGSFDFSDEQVKNGVISMTEINLCPAEDLYARINIDGRFINYKGDEFKILKQDISDLGVSDFADLTIILANVKEKGTFKVSQFVYLKQPQIECKNNCNDLKAEVLRFGNPGQIIEVKISGKINNKNIDCHLKNIRFS